MKGRDCIINLPSEYSERMKAVLGEAYYEYIASFDKKPIRAFHINKVKISEEKFGKISPFGEIKAENRKDCYLFDFDGIGKHPYHHAGMIYIQEPAAMFPVENIDIRPNWNVLDMCAAPGGKSSQIMQRLGEGGHLVSNEIIPSRCKMLTGNFERLGFRNSTVLCAEPKTVAEKLSGSFDLVVCDAPCSGEGMFRKEMNAIPEWSKSNVEICASRQREILSYAGKCVKPGGYLLYSTCTFSEEENEKNVLWFLRENPGYELVKMQEAVNKITLQGTDCAGKYAEYMRRFYPHIAQGEGQFAALMCNTGTNYPAEKTKSMLLRRPDKNELNIIRAFTDSVMPGCDRDKLLIHKDKLIYTDPDYYIPLESAYMTGVTAGTLKRGRVEPHHQFFSAFGNEMSNRIELSIDDVKLTKYLKGESFNVNGEKGWCSVNVNGCSIGGGKIVDGYLKNAYPRGLQNLT